MYSLIKYKNISIQLVYIGEVAWFLGFFFFNRRPKTLGLRFKCPPPVAHTTECTEP